MKKMKKAYVLLIAIAMIVLSACGGGSKDDASDYPTKPVELLVPYAAGGSTDLFFREFASVAEEHLGQKIIVKNETGSGGLAPLITVSNGEADGYTLSTLGTSLYSINPHLDIGDFTGDDFDLLSVLFGYRYVIAVKDDSPFETFEDLIEYSKENEVNYAASSINNNIMMELINQEEDFDLQWNAVMYEGAAEGVAAVLGGHVDFTVDSPIAMKGGVEAGDLRLLVATNASGIDEFPDLPTLESLGYDLDLTAVAGIGGKVGLPDEVIEKWDEVIELTLQDPDLIEFAEIHEYDLLGLTSEESEEYFENQKNQYGDVIDRTQK